MAQAETLDDLKGFMKLLDFKEVTELDVSCKHLLKPFFDDPSSVTSTDAALKLQSLLDYMDEKINIGDWKDVALYIRKTITMATYFKLLVYMSSNRTSDEIFFKEAFKIIDHGLLFGCPLDAAPNLLQSCASLLNKRFIGGSTVSNDCGGSIDKLSEISKIHDTNECKIDILDCPSMEHFYTNHIAKTKPALLRNCINDWPALTKWQDMDYFIKIGGLRTVPVELGSKYTDSEWTQKLMTIKDFINGYVLQANDTKGYLAQYQLFTHIPELRNDIREPEYCCFADTDEGTDINAWFGPKGTVSPLHYDPKKNLLTQVVGEKKVILFAPSDSDHLYPHTDEMLTNTARVDPRQPDLNQFPNFKRAQPLSCVLKAGEMLFIPPKWWHFVESTSVSFSVSFWWN